MHHYNVFFCVFIIMYLKNARHVLFSHFRSHMMCGRSFLISSDSYLVRTYEFTDETPQIDEEQHVMTMDKAQETKLWRYKS